MDKNIRAKDGEELSLREMNAMLSALVKGMKAEEVIKRCKGIDCSGRGTSCPDQLALALGEMIGAEN